VVPMTTAQQAEQTITITVPAAAARVIADELFQLSRDAKDLDELMVANYAERIATDLWRAGWEAV
jgi:hypothetical protein